MFLINVLSLYIIYCSYPYEGLLSLNKKNNNYHGTFTFKNNINYSEYLNTFSCNQFRHPENIKLINQIDIDLSIEYEKFIHFKITDTNNKERYEVPKEILSHKYLYNLSKNYNTLTYNKSLYNFTIENNKNNNNNYFSFNITYNNTVLYSFSKENFIFSETFISFGSKLTTNNIFGFGERFHDFNLGDGLYTIWPNDTGGIKKDDGKGGYNLMGHHPIAIHKTIIENRWLGFVFINSNNQDVLIQTYNNSNNESITNLIHKTTGGIIDYYIIIDTNPESLNSAINFLLGPPTLPPYWSMGYHQSRYGYEGYKNFKKVLPNFIKNQIPIDSIWIDIDTLKDKEIFSLSDEYKNLPKYIKSKIHNDHFKFIPIIDLGVSYENKENNEYIKLGEELDIFIKSNYTNNILITKVWPGKTVFPDFFNPNTSLFWHYGLQSYHDLIKYDGIWLDMNEPAMLETNAKCIGEISDKCDKKDNYYYYDDLPYLPGYRIDNNNRHTNMASGSLNENAICYGKNTLYSAPYNTKPLISFYHCKYSYEFLKYVLKVRPFILSRSTSIGIGKYAFHWFGDNYADLDSMKNSINNVFNFNIFGIPMTGDDICGFFKNCKGKLCNRYTNLGVFYPFSRNHNHLGYRAQFPWSFKNEKIKNNIKNAIKLKYSLIRYYYTEIFKVSLLEKGGLFKPVFYSFPYDNNSYENIIDRIMLGDALILFPFFELNTNDKKVKFPFGNWNRFPNGNKINFDNENMVVKLSGAHEHIHLFIRGGFIVPFQDCFGEKYIKNTYYLLQEKINFIVNPSNDDNNAKGDVIFDNDEIDSLERKKFMRVFIDFKGNEGKINFKTDKNYLVDYLFKDNIIGIIQILNQNKSIFSKFKVILNNNIKYTNSINFINHIYNLNLTDYNIKIENILEINLLK